MEDASEIKPQKEINLILGQGRVVSVEDDQKKKKAKTFVLVGLVVLSISLLGALFIGWQSASPSSKIETKVVSRTKEPEPTTYDPNDPVFWPTHTDAVNLFSLKYPRGTTVGKRPDNPFSVAVALKFDDAVVEVSPGAEKPGWLLTVSTLQANPKNLTLLEWAKDNGLEVPDSARQSLLDGRQTLSWSSAVYPETIYLAQRLEGIVFIKSIINSQQEIKHKETIAKVLATLKFFKRENDPDLGLKWMRRQFGSAWNVEYPDGWQADETGIFEGKVVVEGTYLENSYKVTLSYPTQTNFGSHTLTTENLLGWIETEVSFLSSTEFGELLKRTLDTKIAAVAAKKVLEFPDGPDGPLIHKVFIDKTLSKNRRSIVIDQVSGERDLSQMARLLDRFIKGIK